MENTQETLNRSIAKEVLQGACKHMKTLLVIRGMQNKSSMRYHYTPAKIAKIEIIESIE